MPTARTRPRGRCRWDPPPQPDLSAGPEDPPGDSAVSQTCAERPAHASDLLHQLFGKDDLGFHARSALGFASLPTGVAVEVEALFEIVAG